MAFFLARSTPFAPFHVISPTNISLRRSVFRASTAAWRHSRDDSASSRNFDYSFRHCAENLFPAFFVWKKKMCFFFLSALAIKKRSLPKKKKLNWNWKLVLSFASSSRCGKFIFIAGERLLILEGGGRRPGTRSADGSERDMKFTSVVRAHVGEGCGRGKLCNWQREKEQQSRGGSRRGSRFFSF